MTTCRFPRLGRRLVQRVRMALPRILSALGLALMLTVACGNTAGLSEGETHWLSRCTESADCVGGHSCLCGVCTSVCDATSDCEHLGTNAVCSSSVSTSYSDQCRQDAPASICVRPSDLTPDTEGNLLDVGSALEGIYEMTSHTLNEQSCDSEGDAFVGSLRQEFFFVTPDSSFGTAYVQASACGSVDDCRTKNVMRQNMEGFTTDFSYTFTSTTMVLALEGQTVGSGFTSGDLCTMPTVTPTTMVGDGNGQVTIEARTRVGEDYPPDTDGFCNTDLALEATRGAPCSSYEVISGNRVADL